jgi:hypothetical protein
LFAVLISLIAIILFVPIASTFLETGLVPRFPTLITCGFMMIAALLSLFSGIQLHTIRQQNLQDFEYRLLDVEARFQDKKAMDKNL